ncbi:MAG: cardiolipin synthase [Castellaniella sp.]|jgi:cardiolipin synthase
MSVLTDFLREYWPHLTALLSLSFSLIVAAQAAMQKNDVRAAIAWVGVILMSPFVGAFLYLVAGINRIRHDQMSTQRSRLVKDYVNSAHPAFGDVGPVSAPQFASLRVLCDQVSRFPLQGGNHVTLLDSGDQTYPAMLRAIDEAHHCIALQSYIFDHDRIGLRFAESLRRAQERGVEIRVLIDAVGARYSHPPILRLLERNGIRADRFMTNPLGLRSAYANLRSHRKILFVDGHLGFMGGMNIRESFMASLAGRRADSDTHFRIEGPLATQLFAVFANDWEFATGERLRIEDWVRVSPLPPAPRVPARCIRSGPDRFMAATHRVLLGALAVAQRHVRIQSPYFLPDQVLIGALNTAARRGIQVDIVIPGRNNLRLVNYAMTAQLAQVLEGGCRVWRCRKNFDHSKLLTIDDAWSYVGSSNLDPRSLRLNFELDMEVYDRALAEQLSQRIDADIEQSERVTLESLNAMPYLKRLRNRIIWLASPYL